MVLLILPQICVIWDWHCESATMENMCVELLAGSCQCHQSVMNQSWMFMPAAPYRENNNQTCFHRGGEVRHQASRHPQLNLPPITPITPTTSGASKGPGKMAPMVSELNQAQSQVPKCQFRMTNTTKHPTHHTPHSLLLVLCYIVHSSLAEKSPLHWVPRSGWASHQVQ